MAVKVIIHIVHHVCPENEYLSDEELIDYSIAGLVDDPDSWLASPMVGLERTVERREGNENST